MSQDRTWSAPAARQRTLQHISLSRMTTARNGLSAEAWIEAEILDRQSSNPAKVVSVNATATGGCANHGPHAKHTTAECRGLGKRSADQQDQRGNAKNGKYMNQ